MSSLKNGDTLIFVDTWTPGTTGPFAVYDHDEKFSKYSDFVDIRSIVRRNWNSWSADLEDHYSDISQRFSRKTKWWWLTDSHRFNFFPSTVESTLKPLLFVRAVTHWLEQEDMGEKNDRHKALTIIGVPTSLRSQLLWRSTASTSRITYGNYQPFLTEIYEWGTVIFKGIFHTFEKAIKLFRNHVIACQPTLPSNEVILFSEAINGSPDSGFAYFFGSVEQVILEQFPKTIRICTSINNKSTNINQNENRAPSDHAWLLDFLKTGDLIRALFSTASLTPILLITYFAYWINRQGDRKEKIFLLRFLREHINLSSIFEQFCVLSATRRLLNSSKSRKAIIQYEEKPREKALYIACHDFKVHVTGYAVHPMGAVLPALRDPPKPTGTRPDRYGVCGPAMVDFFSVWGRKPPYTISLWGSGKNGSLSPLKRTKLNFPLTILLLPSYTMQLAIAQKWLRSESYFHKSFRFLIKRNSANLSEDWENALLLLKREFDFVEEIDGSLDEAFDSADLAIYSSTSAGLLAGRHGLISIYADWGDLYEVNPFLGRDGPPLQCPSANNLAKVIKEICAANSDTLQNIYFQQQKFEAEIFSPIHHENIRTSLSV